MFKQITLDDFPKTPNSLMTMKDGVYSFKDKSFKLLKVATKFYWMYKREDDLYWHTNVISVCFFKGTSKEDELNKIYFALKHTYDRVLPLNDDDEVPNFDYRLSSIDEKIKRSKNIQIGVELEIEKNDPHCYKDSYELECSLQDFDLIQDVGSDSSLHNGAEIRFEHPELNNWDFSQVAQILQAVKDEQFDNNWGTAGMHVHISGPKTTRAINRAFKDLEEIKKILMPISCRRENVIDSDGSIMTNKRYGIDGLDCIKDQFGDYGTLEIRAFESTTDPEIFERRLRFCETLYKFLCGPYSIKSFFKRITKEEKENYRALVLDKNNPNVFGGSKEDVLKMLAQ